MTEHKTLWVVYTNTDLTEGRGRQYAKHFCECEATAIRLGKNGYVQGTDCPIEPMSVLILDGQHVLPTSILNIVPPTSDDKIKENWLKLRRAAIAKAKEAGLSDAEISLIRGSTK